MDFKEEVQEAADSKIEAGLGMKRIRYGAARARDGVGTKRSNVQTLGATSAGNEAMYCGIAHN